MLRASRVTKANQAATDSAFMGQFSHQITQALLSCSDLDALGDEIGQAGDLISKFSMKNFTSGIYPEVDAEDIVTESEALSLRGALLRLLHASPNHAKAPSLIWALSKLSDPTLTPVFEQHLESSFRQLLSSYVHLSQCVFALNCRQTHPSALPRSRRGQIIGPVIDSADDFLQSRGILIPL